MKFLDVPQSGSIADRVHSHNRAGQYTRNRRSPVQPIGTGRRAFVRAAFSAASAGWSGLTNVQRAAWDSFAASHPITDSLGQAVVLTGHQMYVRVGSTLINVGEPLPTTPPAVLTLPDVANTSFTYSVATGASFDDFSGSAAAYVAFAVSRPFSAGRSFNKTFWQPSGGSGITPADGAPFAISQTVYNTEFGAPSIGQRVFARITPISEDGFNGTPVIVSTLAVA